MTRRTIPLQQHLLTRSDLARMEILAAELLHWQATGWLEQVGRLSDAEAHGDAVFAVHAPELRQRLASRLEAIGKPAVVMAPQQVRSLLLQALLPEGKAAREHAAVRTNDGAAAIEPEPAPGSGHGEGRELPASAEQLPGKQPAEASPETADAVAATPQEHDLAVALQEAVVELEGALAATAAAAERHEENLEADDEAVEDPTSGECFDADELDATITDWQAEEPPSPAPSDFAAFPLETAIEPPTPVPEALRAEPADEPLPIATATEPSTTTMMTETPAVMTAEPIAAAAATESLAADVPLTRETGPVMVVASDPVVQTQQPPPPRANDTVTMLMSRAETFLGELKEALLAMTQRPEPAAVDLHPLVEAVQSGFERYARQSASTNSAMLLLTERLGGIGQQVEQGVSGAVGGVMERTVAASSKRVAPEPAPWREDRLLVSLLALVVLALCWSVLLWFKTGSPNVALGTLVGANVTACWLAARRDAH